MFFYKKLYVSDSLVSRTKKVCWNLKHNRGQLDIYVIALSKGDDLFDIFHCGLLKQKSFPRKELHVMGIANGYEEAVDLSVRMVSDFHDQYGIMQFKEEFFKQEENNFRR